MVRRDCFLCWSCRSRSSKTTKLRRFPQLRWGIDCARRGIPSRRGASGWRYAGAYWMMKLTRRAGRVSPEGSFAVIFNSSRLPGRIPFRSALGTV